MVADTGVLGENLLVWLVLALGAAMVVGYGMALLRPPASRDERPPAGKSGKVGKGAGGRDRATGPKGASRNRPSRSPGRTNDRTRARDAARRSGDLSEAPVGRSMVMIAIGVLAVVWSAATLLRK